MDETGAAAGDGEGPRAERVGAVRGVDDGDGEAAGVVGMVRRVGEALGDARWEVASEEVRALRGRGKWTE